MGKKKLVVSFSSGHSSAMLAYMCNEMMSEVYDIVNVMANTGKEDPRSLKFAQQCDEYFGLNLVMVEAVINPQKGKGTRHKVVTFETCSRNGEPFEEGIKKYGIPSADNKWCTRELKLAAINSYVKNELGWRDYYTEVGIRADGIDRVSAEKEKFKLIYPLVEWDVTSKERNAFWDSMPFKLELKAYEGNCDFCFEKTLRKLMTVAKDRPEAAEWWEEMASKYGHLKINGKPSYNDRIDSRGRRDFFREHLSAEEIVKMATERDFEPFIDEYKHHDPKLDTGGGCDSGCILW